MYACVAVGISKFSVLKFFLPLDMDVSEDWKYPHHHVINPFPDGCSSLYTAMSSSSALFLYLMILLKLTFFVGGTDEAYHSQLHDEI